MRRFGGENRSISRANCGPGHPATRLALALGLTAATAGVRADDEGPELAPPVDLPAAAPPLTTSRPIVSTPAARGPVLALPGLTTPPIRPGAVAAPTPVVDSSLPALDAPIEMRNAPPAARSTLPPLLETFPMDGGPVIEDAPVPPRSGTRREPASASSSAKPVAPPQPSRRPWLFGGSRPGKAPTPLPSSTPKPGAGTANKVEANSDPAAEAALKRRIERQARAAIGDRARSLEVRVVGKRVAIEAKGVRFLQKRGVRKTLETLPVLSGLRSSIAVLD